MLAARLQGEAEPGTVVISDTTRQLVAPHFELKPMGTRSLKGIARPMELHHVVRPNQAVPASGRGLPESVALIGREGQSSQLRSTWKRLVDSAGGGIRPEESVVVVRGVAGIGKSALAAELASHVQLEGCAVLEANCSPYHGNVALWPIAHMLEQLLGFLPGQPHEDRLAVLQYRLEDVGLEGDALPLLAPLLGLETDERWSRPEVDALALRQETLLALVAWLAHAAASTPTLVLVEDLHWADPTTVDLLGLLATESVPATMILITSRLPLDAPWGASVLDIELEPFEEKEAAALVAALTEGVLDAEQCGLIVERGAGIPLFLQELTRSTVTADRDEVLPPRIHEILTARLRAPGIDFRVAQLAAALGAEFEEEQLRQLAGRPVDEALVRLEEAAIIERVAEVRLGRHRFRHGLLRDAVYETQVLPTRQTTHRRIAELLGSRATSAGDLAVVAQHYDLAGDASQSVPAYIAAAQAAQSTASHTEARRLLDRALELVATMPESDERDLTELIIRMQRTVARAHCSDTGIPRCSKTSRSPRRSAGGSRTAPRSCRPKSGSGAICWCVAPSTPPASCSSPSPTCSTSPDAWFAPEIKSCLGYGAFYQGRLDDAQRWLGEAWEGYHSRSVDAASSPFWSLPHDPVPVTAVALACVAALQGRTGESTAWERRALEKAEELDFPRGPFSSNFVTVYLAWIRMISGKLEEAHGVRDGARSSSRSDTGSTTSSCWADSTNWCPKPTVPATWSSSRCSERG